MTLDYVREDGSHGTITVSGEYGVSMIKSADSRFMSWSRNFNRREYDAMIARTEHVELRGATVARDHGASFARAFVAGLRQGADTAPLIAR